VAIIWRTKLVGHSPSRNLRAVSRSNSCSSVKPMSMPILPPRSERDPATNDAAVHDASVLARLAIDDGTMKKAIR